MTEVAQSMFSGCTALAEVTIPESVGSIGEMAFQNCSSLESIALGRRNATIYIGRAAFAGTTKLTTVTFRGTPQMFDNSCFPGAANLRAAFMGRGAGQGATFARTGSGDNARWQMRSGGYSGGNTQRPN
jgi:hypothetical protein